ncbi:uncharacterized protein LOC135139576 [Zophobas morio]|uniref:uncharacterized protein LOC135139576 n=1 Tax=Zophobas morio TaxID=2755281 RepID=UPI0030839B73
MYIFIRNVELRRKIMSTLKSDSFQPIHTKHLDIVQPALKSWKIMYITFTIMASYTVVIWTIFPILDKSFKKGRLPFAAWYPYDSKKSPFYELTYVYQVLSMWYLTVTNINMDTMIAALMVLTGAQCDILCNNLQTMKIPVDPVSPESFTNLSYVNALTAQLFMYCWFGNEVEIKVDPVSPKSFTHLSYVNALTAQLFMYCWFGNEVEVKLSVISWYELPLLDFFLNTVVQNIFSLIFNLTKSLSAANYAAFNIHYCINFI